MPLKFGKPNIFGYFKSINPTFYLIILEIIGNLLNSIGCFSTPKVTIAIWKYLIQIPPIEFKDLRKLH